MTRRLSLILLLALAVLALFPVWGPLAFSAKYAFLLQKLTGIMILAILAMSLDLLVGVAGLVSLGHAAFFGLGGYMLAILSPQYEAANVWVALPATMAVVAAASAVVGFLAIRTAGIYFIMVTLAFGQMGYYFFNDSKLAGGSDGAYIYVKPSVEAFGLTLINLENKQAFFFTVLGALVAVYALLRVVLASPFGRVLAAIGVNEGRVRGLGFNPTAYKLVAFTIAGALAGLAGFLAATQYGFVSPAMLGWHQSGHVLVMVILGGMGTLFGPVLGAFILELAHFGLEAVTEHWLLPMGALVIAIVLALPKGVAGLLLQWCGTSEALAERGANEAPEAQRRSQGSESDRPALEGQTEPAKKGEGEP
ncbi:Benzoate transport inner-membrane translocator precursor [Paramagnetospirillum magnetotacticum MS-1]|uniref:Benzoate transport inner-membrane translocator n=1 Tax=Paramagnetospirillum magnetotacticum MS-1 TaxID=272627 RepID=A0A0C2YI14_PARME|nr:branched-chain amino acid ABC transporter permease [Paramagnetospirillum magnetotacticum]KIL99389.1 Benzoate transport inner-membrane translocator precursor [Paramagnetospirillum magnetotacticum MS-1]